MDAYWVNDSSADPGDPYITGINTTQGVAYLSWPANTPGTLILPDTTEIDLNDPSDQVHSVNLSEGDNWIKVSYQGGLYVTNVWRLYDGGFVFTENPGTGWEMEGAGNYQLTLPGGYTKPNNGTHTGSGGLYFYLKDMYNDGDFSTEKGVDFEDFPDGELFVPWPDTGTTYINPGVVLINRNYEGTDGRTFGLEVDNWRNWFPMMGGNVLTCIIYNGSPT